MAHLEHPAADYESVMTDGAQLIDVREPRELEGGTLPEAVNIPMGELPDRIAELDPDRPVVLLCRSGNRSGRVAEWLTASGFSRVVNLSGGILAYQKRG
jgi:rhodanese-related sulfurtransferase